MQQPPPPPPASRSGAPPELLDSRDIPPLLQLVARAASLVRLDPRTWRMEFLAGLNQLLPAAASAAFIVKNIHAERPEVVSAFDAGFRAEARAAFLHEFNTAPFRDPFARRALAHFAALRPDLYTVLRSDLVDDAAWDADTHVRTLRLPSATGDGLLSIQRGGEPGAAHILYLFGPSAQAGQPANPFTPRQRAIVDVLHAGLAWIYHEEESLHRMNLASGLAPRLRQTLECLLAGDTERQAAHKMSLSIHTVHDYVKALYTHFGVSSRGELLAKWIQTGGQLPPSPPPANS